MVDEAVLKFGRAHLEVTQMLDAIAGGSGFYSGPTTRVLLDSFAFGETFLSENSLAYSDNLITTARDAAQKGELTDELRREMAVRFSPIASTKTLIQTAEEIDDPHQKQVRLDQANSLAVVAKVLLGDLGMGDYPDYKGAVEGITGVSPPLIPTAQDMQQFKARTLQLMGKPTNASLREAASEWRESIGILDRDAMGKAYETAAQLMFEILKKHGLPSDAKLRVYTVDKADFMGFFDYGNKAGDVYGETCMLKSDTKTVFEVIATAVHEIGGHYFVDARWHDYARRTGDLFPATGVMATNQAVINEGYANCAHTLFADDLTHLFKEIGFGLDAMDETSLQTNLRISNQLEALAMMSLGYLAARFFDAQDIDHEGVRSEFIEYGCDPDRAATRTRVLCEAPNKLVAYCYFGPGYYPGMHVVNKVADRLGNSKALDLICTESGPNCLSSLFLEAK